MIELLVAMKRDIERFISQPAVKEAIENHKYSEEYFVHITNAKNAMQIILSLLNSAKFLEYKNE